MECSGRHRRWCYCTGHDGVPARRLTAANRQRSGDNAGTDGSYDHPSRCGGCLLCVVDHRSYQPFDRRHVLWVLLSLLVVSNAVIACANGLPVLLLGRVVLGVAVGGFWTIGVSLGARLRPDAVGKATSIVFSGVTFGTVAGVPAGTMLGALFGWRMSFAVSAVLAALLVVALVRLLPAIRPEPSSRLKHVPSVLKLPTCNLVWWPWR